LRVDVTAPRDSSSRKVETDRQSVGIDHRYDKLAANYVAFIQLASIKQWLRVNESAP